MKLDKRRTRLFSYLDDLLSVSQKKFKTFNKQDKERRAWARITIQAINAYGKLLETVQLDQLAHEIEQIKEKIEHGKHQTN